MSDSELPPPPGPADGSPAPTPARSRGKLRKGAAAASRGAKRAGSASSSAAKRTLSAARRASSAQGAGESGLFRLIELHAFNAAGDAAVAIALAGTIFFVQPGEAREQVALFLGLTMLPFVFVAPLLGPFLDRFSHGRRWAIGATMAGRGLMCLWLADSIASNSPALYPAALGCLVASKSYGVCRAATVPRLLPHDLTLVKANGRISLAGVVGAALSAPIAVAAATLGPEWALRYAFVVFCGATILSILLPRQVDSSTGELPARIGAPRLKIARSTIFALRCNIGLRVLSGFLAMYIAFLFQKNPLPGWEGRTTVLLGLVLGAAGLGNTIGIASGSLSKKIDPRITVVAVLIADCVAATFAALFYGLTAAIALGLTAGVAQSLGKLALDSTIQTDVPEDSRTSAFARSETYLQLSWVIGGFAGIALPLIPRVGLGLLATFMIGWTVLVVLTQGGRMLPQRKPA